MAKNKVSEWSTTAASNTDIAGINIAEGCAPSGINNAIREVMAQIKDMQTGADSDGLVVGGAFTSSGGAVFSSGTTFSAAVVMSSTVAMSNNVTMTGAANTIGTTTSATILSGSVTQTSGSVLYLDAAATTPSAPPLSWSGDTNTGVYRPATDTLALVTNGIDRLRLNSSGVVIIGTGEATTSVTGNILRAPSGTGTNVVGADFEINAGNGTGTGGSGSIVIKTADVGSSGSTANTLTQRLKITPKGGFSFGSGATSYGTAGQVLLSNGDAAPSFGSALIPKTVVNASGTTFEFTAIPSWVKRITIAIAGLSTSGAGDVLIQLGTSSSYETSGYLGAVSTSAGTAENFTTGFKIVNSNSAANLYGGVITLVNLDSNTWVESGNLGISTATLRQSAGYKSLSAALTRLQFNIDGTQTFDAGTVNILYE
jgi:hypothetical protein